MSGCPDRRNIITGWEIPTSTYSDQPYIVRTDDGAWLCCVTTGVGREGEPGQIVTSMRSTDRGQSWSAPLAVEPAEGPEASYAVMLKAPTGRIFIFYNHNSDNLREIIADESPWFPQGKCKRVDSLGYFVFKYSDDHGRSWSSQRHVIPIRETQIDTANPYGGKVRFFWNVGKPFIYAGVAYVSLHKVGRFGDGFFVTSEGVLLRSDNLLSINDPSKAEWETLPDGEIGLRTPPGGGTVAEEQSYSVLSDGSFFCVYRSIDGYPVCSYSRDGGHTWSLPAYMQFADGRRIKHPRAANFAWRCENGKFLYWFHNHGGRFIHEHPRQRTNAYEDRNPVWLCGGIEVDSQQGKMIQWSQPEIVLYDDDPYIRMSYPDLVEEGGEYYLTETQKDKARVHQIDRQLVESLWGQFDRPQLADKGCVLSLSRFTGEIPREVEMPRLPMFAERDTSRADYGTRDLRMGFTLELWVKVDHQSGEQIILDNCADDGKGMRLHITPRGTLDLILNDGRCENHWDCDQGALRSGQVQHVVVTVDGGPKIITYVIDGHVNDGGESRQFGWGRFNPNYRGPCGGNILRIGNQVHGLRIYNRALRNSEAVGNYRVGLSEVKKSIEENDR